MANIIERMEKEIERANRLDEIMKEIMKENEERKIEIDTTETEEFDSIAFASSILF